MLRKKYACTDSLLIITTNSFFQGGTSNVRKWRPKFIFSFESPISMSEIWTFYSFVLFFLKIIHRLWSSIQVKIYILIKSKNIKNKYQFCTNVSCVKYVLSEYWPVQLPISEKKILNSWLFITDFSENMQPTPSLGP